MKDPAHRRIAGWVLAALVLALFHLGRDRVGEAPSQFPFDAAPPSELGVERKDNPPAARVELEPQSTAARPEPAFSGKSTALQQPVPGTAVPAVVAALDGRAGAGDAVAACRLAIELLSCQPSRTISERQVDTVRRQILNSSASADETLVELDRLDDVASRAAQRALSCEGIDRALLTRVPRYALMGARAGSPSATALFLSGEHVSPGLLVADPGLAAAYRQHGWPMLRGLIESGNPAGAFLWASSLRGESNSPISELIPPEWRTPDVASALRNQIAEAMRLPSSGGTLAAPQPSAVAAAEQLFQRHFANSPWLRLIDTAAENRNSPSAHLDVQRWYEQQLVYCDPVQTP